VDYPLSKKIGCCEVILDNIKFTAFSWEVHTWVTDTERRLTTLRNLAGVALPSPPMMSMYNMGMPDPNFDFFDPYNAHPLFPPHCKLTQLKLDCLLFADVHTDTNQAFLEEPMRDLDQPFMFG